MASASGTDRVQLRPLLVQLRDLLLAQAEALGADDFERLEILSAERDGLVADLGAHTAAEVSAEDRVLLDQIGALDQRLLEMTRAGQAQVANDLREVHRGRGALAEYQRRGQNLIHNLAQLDFQR